VVVQGPPGTGKTHTIANLMGHFLAQGKSVLVTSHTKKALTVVKGKVNKSLQDLCVSMLEDNNKDMERSIDGITEYISKHSSSELYKKSEELKKKRVSVLNELNAVRDKIYALKHKEVETISFDGKGYSVSEAAKFVYQNEERLSYIPGKVKLYKPLPVTIGDLELLYKTNSKLTSTEEAELDYSLPNPTTILLPQEFNNLIEKYQDLLQEIEENKNMLNINIDIDFDKKRLLLNGVNIYKTLNMNTIERLMSDIAIQNNFEEWHYYAIFDGKKSGGYKETWKELISCIEDACNFSDSIVGKILGKSLENNCNLS